MRPRWAIVILSVFALVVAACTSSDGTENGGDGTGVTGVTGGEPVTLTLWAFEGEEAFFPTLKERFEADHPNITLEITEIPEDNYATKVDTALAAGRPPDMGLTYEQRWFKAGAVLPLDDLIEAKSIDLTTYNQNAMSGCRFEDHVYCLGSYTGAVLLFYNKELFDAAGVPYPSATEPMTIDEFATVAAQVSQPNQDLAKRVWGTVGEAPFWWSDPITHFSEDGRTTQGYMNDAPTAHLYDVMSGLVRDGYAPTGSEFELLGTEDLLSAGQVAMAISDNLVAIDALETNGIDWGAAPVPIESSGAPVYVASWTDQVGVFASSEHAQEAKEFVAFLGTVGNELRIEVADQLPLDSATPGAETWAAESEGRAEVMEAVALAREAVFVPGFWDVTSPLWDSYDAMVAGDMTPQEALDDAAPVVQDNLDQAWETWEAIS
ncbi:MAG TPA: sugar ABC transporter substrate-binding protein [Actinomycetota bacterium]|nr:sugar ABC transporter substrate-binding protein [Actinomycetota bacterium]